MRKIFLACCLILLMSACGGLNTAYHSSEKQWYQAAIQYTKGLGTRKNLETAKEYYGRACDLGSQRGCDNHNAIKERDIILSR